MKECIKKIGLMYLIILFACLLFNKYEFLFILTFLLFLIIIFILFLIIPFKILIFIIKNLSSSTHTGEENNAEDKKEVREIWPYRKRDYFFNLSERKFYYTLSDILGDKYFLFSKVRILDLLYLPKYLHNSYRYLNKIQSKHIDFIICDKQNIEPILAIELDGSSHLRKDRIERDKFVNEIFENAGLSILHIKVSDSCNKSYLSDIIGKEIELENVESECLENV